MQGEVNENTELLLRIPENTVCANCRNVISIELVYVCTSGHDICKSCNVRLNRCLVCLKNILDTPYYFCAHQPNGCHLKAPLCDISRHQSDCDYKKHFCPFYENGCEVQDVADKLPLHLRICHADKIIVSDIDTGMLPRKDHTSIFIAFEKVFKCYLWIYEFHVEWLMKYIGPQRHAKDYSYKLKLYRSDNLPIFKYSMECTGQNTSSLDKCISIPYSQLKEMICKGPVKYCIKIVNNNTRLYI